MRRLSCRHFSFLSLGRRTAIFLVSPFKTRERRGIKAMRIASSLAAAAGSGVFAVEPLEPAEKKLVGQCRRFGVGMCGIQGCATP